MVNQNWQDRGRNPGNAGRGGRVGVFGCILGCVSYTEGDDEAQGSISPTVGGGLMICSTPSNDTPDNNDTQCSGNDSPNMYDPANDDELVISPSVTRGPSFGGRGGAGLGITINPDGSVCVNIGLFFSPTPFSISLGGLSE